MAPHTTNKPYYQIVREELASNIQSGRIPTGTLLYEAAVADRLRISRPPVKRALELLAQDGLVRRSGKRGYVVGEEDDELARYNLHLLNLDISPRLGGDLGRPTWQRIYSAVERDVLHSIPFGTFQISEPALGEFFRVSRTVVRDVLARLHSRGLTTKSRRSHWIAGPMSARMLEEHHEMRRLLEPQALLDALPAIPRSRLEGMRQRVSEVLVTGRTVAQDVVDLVEADLHEECLGFGRNQRLLDTIRQCQLSLVVNRVFGMYFGIHDESEMLTEHRLVFDHLAVGDGAGASAALGHHLDTDHRRTRARLKVLSVFSEPDTAPYLMRIH